VGRKCRTDKVEVLAAYNVDGVELTSPDQIFSSNHNPNFTYGVGQIVEEQTYNDDIRVEGTTGIHFFMTRKEALEY
jgi:hypothetical protein